MVECMVPINKNLKQEFSQYHHFLVKSSSTEHIQFAANFSTIHVYPLGFPTIAFKENGTELQILGIKNIRKSCSGKKNVYTISCNLQSDFDARESDVEIECSV